MANFPLMGTLAPSVSSLPRPKRDWRASLFDRLNPQGIPGLELDDAEKAKLGRQSLLNAGLAMLQTRGQGIGGTLAAGLSQGLLSARQGPQDLVNDQYRQQMMQRTMAGADRNTQAEELARRAVRQDGAIDQQVYSQLAAVDPDRAKSLREAIEGRQTRWQMGRIGDGQGGEVDVLFDPLDPSQIRTIDGQPINGGFGQSPGMQGRNVGVVQQPGFEQLASAVMAQESGGNPNAVSPKGAMGTMQTMPGTLRDPGFGVAPAKDNSPAEMQRVGVDYLRQMIGRYGQEGGLAAYNWGPGNWERALAAAGGDVQRALSSAPRETQNYVPGVQRRLSQVPQSAGFGRRPAKAKESERYRTLTADEVKALGLPEGTVAQSSPTGQVQIVNKPRDLPGAQTQVIDNGDGTQTIIPAGKTTEDQNKSAGYALRMEQALKHIAQASAIDPNANRPGLLNAVVDMLPDAAGNYFKSTGRQNVEAAQLDALDAALTLNTGAAYTKEQLRGLAKSYFPQPGNTPEVIKQKEERLRSLIQTARLRARGAYPTTQRSQSSDSNARISSPPPGAVQDGYQFRGGDPADPMNWKRL